MVLEKMNGFTKWMFAAILMICGLVPLTSCSSDDDNKETGGQESPEIPEDGAPLASFWYANYDFNGQAEDDEGNVVGYTHVVEYYNFEEDGTGYWGVLYFNEDGPYAVAVEGGPEEGSFKYTLADDGYVNLEFPDDSEYADQPVSRAKGKSKKIKSNPKDASYKKGKLTSKGNHNKEAEYVTGDEEDEETIKEMATESDTDDSTGGGTSSGTGTAPAVKDGERVYGVGFGYDFILDHATALSASPILNIKKIIKDKGESLGRTTGGVTYTAYFKNHTGQSMSEISKKLSSEVKVSGGGFGFNGEVGAAFQSSSSNSATNEYCLSVMNIGLWQVVLGINTREAMLYRTKEFRMAVRGINWFYKGQEGIKHLIRDFGTHLVMKARLGGRLRYAMTVETSKVEGEYSLEAWANASYSNIWVDASAKVNTSYTNSFKKNDKAVNVEVTAFGGTPQAVSAMRTARNDLDKWKDWEKSLHDIRNTSIVGIDLAIPIWELVDYSKDPKMKDRIAAIQNYITGGGYEADMSKKFTVGKIGKITDVDKIFTDEDIKSGSLVKDLKMDGANVARACLEYIPQLNEEKRSLVLYPVVNNQPKYNLGYFVGNNTYPPKRICWSNSTAAPSVIDLAGESAGAKNELYLLGCSFLHMGTSQQVLEDKTAEMDEVSKTPRYMVYGGYDSNGTWNESHQYPLVKVFNHVWTRENFSNDKNDPKGLVLNKGKGDIYYNYQTMNNHDQYEPSGWRFPTYSDVKQLKDELEARQVQQPALKMAVGGIIGFDAPWKGWYTDGVHGTDESAYFWCHKDDDYKVHYYVELLKSGNIAIVGNSNNSATHGYTVRFIEK